MWDKMEVFYQVVKAGSFTKAEKVLNKSQGTLSRSVAILEERLDARLLRRKIKGLELTRKGEEVFRVAQRMFIDIDNMKTILDEEEGVQGKIRISTTYAIANYVISDAIFDFNQQYPDVVFEIICNDSIIDIIQNEVDIAITPELKDSSGIIQKHLYTTQPSLYASVLYIEKFGVPETIKDLDNHKLLAYARPLSNPYFDIEWHLKSGRHHQEKRNPIFTANSLECLFEAAERGIGIIPSYKVMKIIRKSSLININPNIKGPEYKIYVTYPKKVESTEKIKSFSNYLLKKFSEDR